MELRKITDGVWEAQYDLKIGIVPFVSRMTVVRLSDGSLWVHSPGPIDDAAAAEIDQLGEVSAIIAPNQFHHLYLQDFAARTNNPPLFAAKGLANKRPDLQVASTLAGTAPISDWQDDFELLAVGGMPKFEEVIFLHKPSSSLIVTDLLFNLGTEMPFLTQLATRAFGTYGRFAVSRLFRSFIRDRAAFQRSLEQLADWQYDRVIMAHGSVLEQNASARVRETLGA